MYDRGRGAAGDVVMLVAASLFCLCNGVFAVAVCGLGRWEGSLLLLFLWFL